MKRKQTFALVASAMLTVLAGLTACSKVDDPVIPDYEDYEGEEGSTYQGSTTEGEFIDLGLRSGIKWKTVNEQREVEDTVVISGRSFVVGVDWFTQAEAQRRFGNSLPRSGAWEELQSYCRWKWTGDGYTATGPNGASIFFPARGRWIKDPNSIRVNGILYRSYVHKDDGTKCYYWTNSEISWGLNLAIYAYGSNYYPKYIRCSNDQEADKNTHMSIRLVQYP